MIIFDFSSASARAWSSIFFTSPAASRRASSRTSSSICWRASACVSDAIFSRRAFAAAAWFAALRADASAADSRDASCFSPRDISSAFWRSSRSCLSIARSRDAISAACFSSSVWRARSSASTAARAFSASSLASSAACRFSDSASLLAASMRRCFSSSLCGSAGARRERPTSNATTNRTSSAGTATAIGIKHGLRLTIWAAHSARPGDR